MKRGQFFRLGAAAAALGAIGLIPISASASGGGGPVAQSVLGSGSNTTQFMMSALDTLYLYSPGCAQIPTPSGPTPWLDFSCQATNPAGTITTENYEHDQVHEAYFLGSSNGINQLCDQKQAGVAHIDFARSSRAPGTSDCTGLKFVAYARDAISWEAFANSGSGINTMKNTSGTCAGSTGTTKFCLSQAQLQGIYVTCTITNWDQVGGANVPISIYTPQPGSGTRSAWDGFLGGSSSNCIPAAEQATHIIPENSNTAIPVSDRKGAIFPFSFGVWSTQVKGAGGAKFGTVDKIVANATTIANGTFPYGRFLYNVYATASCACGASSAATVNYVGEQGWICKATSAHAVDPTTGVNYATEISKTITSFGFVHIPLGVIGGGDSNSDFCRLFTT
jgi:hypothetical protein